MKRNSIHHVLFFYIICQLAIYCSGQYYPMGPALATACGSGLNFGGPTGLLRAGYNQPFVQGFYGGYGYPGSSMMYPYNNIYGHPGDCSLAFGGMITPGFNYGGPMMSGLGYASAGLGYGDFSAPYRYDYMSGMPRTGVIPGSFGMNRYVPTVGNPRAVGLVSGSIAPVLSPFPANQKAILNTNENTNVNINNDMNRHRISPFGRFFGMGRF